MSYPIEVLSVGADFDTLIEELNAQLNAVQTEFVFSLPSAQLRDRGKQFVQQAYNTSHLFEFLTEYRTDARGHRPFLIAVISGDLASENLGNLFGSHRADEGLAVINMKDAEAFVKSQSHYLRYYLIRYAISFVAPDLKNHDDTRGCFFDKKLRKADIAASIETGSICDPHRRALQRHLNSDIHTAIESMVALLKGKPGVAVPEGPDAAAGQQQSLVTHLDAATRWLSRSVQAVPANRYAIGVVGVAAAVSIILGLLTDIRVAFFGLVAMLAFMVVLRVVSEIILKGSRIIGIVAGLVMCIVTLSFGALVVLSVSALAFGQPRPLRDVLLGNPATNEANLNDRSDAQPNGNVRHGDTGEEGDDSAQASQPALPAEISWQLDLRFKLTVQLETRSGDADFSKDGPCWEDLWVEYRLDPSDRSVMQVRAHARAFECKGDFVPSADFTTGEGETDWVTLCDAPGEIIRLEAPYSNVILTSAEPVRIEFPRHRSIDVRVDELLGRGVVAKYILYGDSRAAADMPQYTRAVFVFEPPRMTVR